MQNIRILLADDHQMIRQCLRSLLQSQQDMQIVGEAADGREAVRLAEELSPDVVLMDVEMAGLNGIEATRQVVRRVPGAKVVALSAFADDRRVGQMMEAGAASYVPKALAFRDVADAVCAAAGTSSDGIPRVERGGSSDSTGGTKAEASSAFRDLTSREHELLQLLAEGESTKGIARALHICVKTVETHRRRIMEKLDLHSVAELTKYAVREGLTPLED